MHLVVKSDRMIFKKYLIRHRRLVLNLSKRYQIKLYEFQFNGNHLHLVARFYSRDTYKSFIRVLTSQMATISGAAKCFPLRPYTRIISWGHDLKNCLRYLRLNEFESEGLSRSNAKILLAALDPPAY